jgi:hypothetical protein
MILETHGPGYYGAPKDKGKYYQEVQLFRDWDRGLNCCKGKQREAKIVKLFVAESFIRRR